MTTINDKPKYRILTNEGKIKFAGTNSPSWLTLDAAKKEVDYSKDEKIYEYSHNNERLWEVI